MELEAIFYQLQSKYLLVLNEMNKPQLGELSSCVCVDYIVWLLVFQIVLYTILCYRLYCTDIIIIVIL